MFGGGKGGEVLEDIFILRPTDRVLRRIWAFNITYESFGSWSVCDDFKLDGLVR
jgi:hypothetical protein